MTVHSRLPDVGTSIFAVMSKMALEHQAINLSQGFPDFPVSSELIELIHEKMREGFNQYAPMPGTPALRNAISKVVKSTYDLAIDPDTEITITAGGTEALFAAISALVNQGDEVIIFDPSYDSYGPAVRLNGGKPVHLNLKAPDFHIDWDQVRSHLTANTKMIIVNTPHNPCGAVLTEQDLKTLENIAIEFDLIVLSDEVYERIIFDGLLHQSVLRFPLLAARSIAVFSFGKTFHATGWKIGYTVAPAVLTTEIRKAHQFITFSVNTPIQLAIATYLENASHYLELGKFYQSKRDFFLNALKGSSLQPLPCHGSYFQLVSYQSVTQKREAEMAEWMTRELKVAPIPVSAFYKDGTNQCLLRLCFAKGEETLQKAGEILRKI